MHLKCFNVENKAISRSVYQRLIILSGVSGHTECHDLFIQIKPNLMQTILFLSTGKITATRLRIPWIRIDIFFFFFHTFPQRQEYGWEWRPDTTL